MAFGTELGGSGSFWGKLALSTFRLLAIGALGWYLRKLVKQEAKPLMIAAIAMIFAGALGNMLDSMFYGLLFSESGIGHMNTAAFFPADGGYAPFLFGNVVDMIEFTFFPYVFNVADSAVTIGVAILILWNKSFFGQKKQAGPAPESVSSTSVS
jgi:signal peptidase II